MEKPEGYPYLRMTCITERPQWVSEEDREDTYYEAHPITIDFSTVSPMYWHRYKLRNPETAILENCIVTMFTDVNGNSFELMFAETFPKFDKIMKEWIEYAITQNNDNGEL